MGIPVARCLLLVSGFLVGCLAPDPSQTCQTATRFSSRWEPRFHLCPPQIVDCEPEPPCGVPLTPDQLIDIALRNHPQTRQSWHLARAAAYDVGVAKSDLYPTVTGSETITAPASHGVSVVSTGDTTDTVVSGGGPRGRGNNSVPFVTSEVSLSYLLLDLGGRSANIEAARYALMSANWAHNRTIQNVILAVLTGYYDYENALGLLNAREQDLTDAETNLTAAQQQFEMGVSTRVDVLQAQSTFINAKLQLETARGQVNTTMGQLATALSWPANTTIEVAPMPTELPMDVISEDVCVLLERAKTDRPDLAAAYSAFLELSEQVKIATSAALPTLTLTGNAQRNDFINNSRFNSSSQSAAIALNVPIFAGGLYANQIRSAREAAEAAYAAWRNQEDQALLQVVSNYYAYLTAVETVHYSDEYLRYAREAYEAALMGYRVGTNSILDVITAQATLSHARSQWIQSHTGFFISLANVAYAIGTL